MEWLEKFLSTDIAKYLAIPAVGSIGLGIRYLLRRKVERSGDTTELAHLHSAADLHAKLTQQQISIDDLVEFRKKALGQSAKAASDTAQVYIDRASYLVTSSKMIEEETTSEVITQADMNAQAFEQFEAANTELTNVILEKMSLMDEPQAAAFHESQQNWIKWRDSEAEWESATWEGGSIRPFMVAVKLEQMTRERIASILAVDVIEGAQEPLSANYKRAPRDLPDQIEPGITADRVKELIGTAHYVYERIWHYRFQELQMELTFNEGVLIEVTFAMVQDQTFEVELAMFGPFKFGELTFADLVEFGAQPNFQFRSTLRTRELYCQVRLGPSGAWRDYYFGAIAPFSGTALAYTQFDWDEETSTLKTPLDKILVNWFGQNNKYDDAPWASWSIR